MTKKITLLTMAFLLLISSTILFANEFWLMPNKFRVNIKEKIALAFYVGEDFKGEIWKKKKGRILNLSHLNIFCLNNFSKIKQVFGRIPINQIQYLLTFQNHLESLY